MITSQRRLLQLLTVLAVVILFALMSACAHPCRLMRRFGCGY